MRVIGKQRFLRLAVLTIQFVVLSTVALVLWGKLWIYTRETTLRNEISKHTITSDIRSMSSTIENQVIYHENQHKYPSLFSKLHGKHSRTFLQETNKNHKNVHHIGNETRNNMVDKSILIKKRNELGSIESSLPTAGISSTKVSDQIKPETRRPRQERERFIIYLCDRDKTKDCYGLGDRQRSVASLYLLSLLTNRTFGIIWTQPCALTKFIQPNDVNWDIPAWRLEGKSSIEIEFLGFKRRLYLNVSFNTQYPQDVVYIRTNKNYVYDIRKSPIYQPHIPAWARGKRDSYVSAHLWKMLMKPTELLRKPLNEMLVKIFLDQKIDNNIVNSLGTSRICRDACDSLRKYDVTRNGRSNATMNVDNTDYFNDTRLREDRNVVACLSEIHKNQSSKFPKRYHNTTQINHELVSWRNLNMFCKSKDYFKNGKNEIVNNKINVETIRKAKDYDVVDLNLVCIHARIGQSPDMPFDPVRNLIESTGVLWDFSRPYMERGQHLYISTDYDKVRQDSKTHFGLRAHSSNTPIVHIATVQENQNETEGMALALWEQLLLMTSCRTLVMSQSGFSRLAKDIRGDLVISKETYIFKRGMIIKIL